MGEHAVVYGRPAIAAAIDLRLTVRVSPSPTGIVHLDLPSLGHSEDLSWQELHAYARRTREGWSEYSRTPEPERFQAMRGEDPAHVVKTALGEAVEFLGETAPPGIRVTVESRLPVGSGFGSSAATAAGTIAGYLAFRGASVDPGELERLTLEAERRQHGFPSGIDGATVIRGGLLWARKLASGGLESERIAPRSPLLSKIRVYDTGTPPDSTGAVVAAVRSRRDRDPGGHERLLDNIEAATHDFRAELSREREDSARVRDLFRACQVCLEAMAVVPPAVGILVRRIEAEGGAAKISGAGSLAGPGGGSLLVYHDEPERISGWPFLRPFPAYHVHLGAAGLHPETDT